MRLSENRKPRFFYGYVVVAATFCIMVVTLGTSYTFGVFFKPVLTEFGWTRALTSGAFSLSMLMAGLIGIVMGGLNDRFGPRVLLTVCGVLLGLGYFLMSQISAVWQLYLFYGVIIGIAMSGVWPPLMSTVTRWFSRRRSMMSGIVLTSVGIGGLISPLVADYLISTYDWRTSYIILGSFASVVVVLAAQLLKRDPSQIGQMPDGDNKRGGQEIKLEAEGFSLKGAVYTRQLYALLAVSFCFGFSQFVVVVHIAPHATELGFSASSAAKVLATISGLSIVGRIIMGSAADKIGNRLAYAVGFILMSLALFWLITATNIWMLYLFAAVFGFAFASIEASEAPIVARIFGLRSHGLIYGIAGFSFTIGAAIGPFLAGYIFDVTGGYEMAFLVSAIVGLIGLILTTLLVPITSKYEARLLTNT
ncbi:MFS transporter [Chloroflexota bacterium]